MIDASTTLLATLAGALGAGLAASLHCAGMCGSLQAAAAPPSARAWPGLVRLQVGRSLAYVTLGAIAGWLGGALGDALATGATGTVTAWLRLLAAALATLALASLGIRLLAGRDLFGLERIGARLWNVVKPLASHAGRWREPWASLGLGFGWAFIPCGLVLSMAVVAATRGSALEGAALMGAFALGTWPALLGAGWLAGRGRQALSGGLAVRRVAGVGLLVLAGVGWGAALPTGLSPGASPGLSLGHSHPVPAAGADCVTPAPGAR